MPEKSQIADGLPVSAVAMLYFDQEAVYGFNQYRNGRHLT